MRRLPPLAPVLLALTVLCALAAPASARTFCVSDPHCVSVGGVDRGADLQAALTAATSTAGADTVKIGAGRFSAAGGFAAIDNRDAIAVVGAGRDLTTLTATTVDSRVLDFGASRDATVSDLTIAMPPRGGVGVFVPQHIARVAIGGGRGSATALWTQNTTVDDVSIELPLDGSSNKGVYRPNGTLRADGLTITANTGIDGFAGSDTYKHLRVTSDGTGVSLGSSIGNTMTIDDAQIRLRGAGIGLRYQAIFGTAASLTAHFLTLRGDGTTGSTGIDSHGSSAGSVASVTLENSIVAGFDHALSCSVASSGAARLVARFSAFDPSDLVNGCATAIDTRTGNLAAVPPLTATSDGDLLLPAGSPAIDAGDPALTTPAPATDLAGNARLVDGNGDGTARVDMGAFEYAPPPPIVPISPGGGGSGGSGGSGGTGGSGGSGGGGSRAGVPPARLSVTAFHIIRARASRRGRRPHRGATFGFKLSRDATVTIRVVQRRRARRGRRSILVTLRTLRRAFRAGDHRLGFDGRDARGHALTAGRYGATIVAKAGSATATAKSVAFRIVGS